MFGSKSGGRSWCSLAALLTILLAAGDVKGQQSQQNPCADEAHHQFDFWVGTWEVSNAQGNVVGTNRISSILGGCVLFEEWQSAGPYSGKSLNIYDAATDKWHQTWVDNGGLLLELDGKLVDGNMVMQGHRPGQDGSEVLHRITWEVISFTEGQITTVEVVDCEMITSTGPTNPVHHVTQYLLSSGVVAAPPPDWETSSWGRVKDRYRD